MMKITGESGKIRPTVQNVNGVTKHRPVIKSWGRPTGKRSIASPLALAA